jgi:hypothetical protein
MPKYLVRVRFAVEKGPDKDLDLPIFEASDPEAALKAGQQLVFREMRRFRALTPSHAFLCEQGADEFVGEIPLLDMGQVLVVYLLSSETSEVPDRRLYGPLPQIELQKVFCQIHKTFPGVFGLAIRQKETLVLSDLAILDPLPININQTLENWISRGMDSQAAAS